MPKIPKSKPGQKDYLVTLPGQQPKRVKHPGKTVLAAARAAIGEQASLQDMTRGLDNVITYQFAAGDQRFTCSSIYSPEVSA